MLCLASPINSQNYFTYDDCSTECITKHISCIITTQNKTDFLRRCTPSAEACNEEAGPDSVCLRPDLPPIGGEHIWMRFKQKYHPSNDPNDTNQNGIFHIVLATSGLLLGMVVILTITNLCTLSRTDRTAYEPMNPSPHRSRENLIENLYLPTTRPIQS